MKKNVVTLYNSIVEQHEHFPFHVRKYLEEDPNSEKAIQELAKQHVLVPQIFAEESKGELVAQFKLTAAITANGLILLSGNKWVNSPLENVKSTHSIEAHPHLAAILEKDVLKKKKPKSKKK